MNGHPYRGQPPHAAGSDTSLAAARAVAPVFMSKRSHVFYAIRRSGLGGLTDNEIEIQLGMLRQSVCARRRELVLEGLVCDSGRRRLTATDFKAVVWVATMHTDRMSPPPRKKRTRATNALVLLAEIETILDDKPDSLFPDPRIVAIRVLLDTNKKG